MPYTLSEIIVLFFTYSFIGWLWETCYCSIKDKHYDYRGFLFGPYCPVYGFAVTTIFDLYPAGAKQSAIAVSSRTYCCYTL